MITILKMKTKKIFQSFIKNNDLEVVINFRDKTKEYTGLGYDSIIEEKLMGSIEFTGYVDGFCGNQYRFEKQAKGTVNAQATEESNMALDLLYKIRDSETNPFIKEKADMAIDDCFISQIQKYEFQFNLGRSCYKRIL
jgi:hypothetical protein